jgi:pimeloyl-ACP methyl ester carboxylesterase
MSTRDALEISSLRMINTRHGAVAIHDALPVRSPSPEPPPLLLLHANPGDSRDFEAIAPSLSRHFRTIAIDWPGYGASHARSPELLSAMAYADCLEDVVSALQVATTSFFAKALDLLHLCS